MQKEVFIMMALGWTATACTSEPRCPEGSIKEGDRCIEMDSGADGADGDGGADAPLPCNNACSGTTPYCEEVADECVACLDNAHCTLTVAARCEQSTHTCAGCTADSDCERFTDTPVCDETSGACVECTLDTQEAQCTDSQACDTNFVCKTDSCRPCTADSECLSTHRCIELNFQGTDYSACLQLAPTQDVSDSCLLLLPFTNFLTDRMSVSGAAAADYCGPTTTTTCQGVLDLIARKSCSVPADCGITDPDDSLCELVEGANACSYACDGNEDCPVDLACIDGPNGFYCGDIP